MLNSTYKYLALVMIMLSSNPIYSQTNNKKNKEPNPLVAEIIHRNEFSINISPIVSLLSSGGLSHYSFITSIGYSRNFGKNHYLRGGIKANFISVDLNPTGNDYNINTFYNTYTYRTAANQHLPSFTDQAMTGYSNHYQIRTSLYAGYEHLFGKRRTRFLLGIDMFAGITYSNLNDSRKYYQVTYTLDSTTNQYNNSAIYLSHSGQSIRPVNFHFGFSPRLGIRFEVSKKIALTAIFCPMFYFDSGYYIYTSTGFLKLSGIGFSSYLAPVTSEIGLVIKL